MSTNCLNVLQNYGDFLSNNPLNSLNDSPMPHPLLFSDVNCSGSMWPAFETYPETTGKTFIIKADENWPLTGSPVFALGQTPKFGSIYIPAFWRVILHDSFLQREISSSEQPRLVTDTSALQFSDSNTPVKDTVFSVEFIPEKPYSQEPYSQSNWIYGMCNNIIHTSIGSRVLGSYKAGSEECDRYMYTYCEGDNLLRTECACLRDELKLEHTYCHAGSNTAICESSNLIQQVMPVTCFGETCSSQGYRFARMRDQKCSITLCQQVVNIIGENLVVESEANLYCGTKSANEMTATPPASSSNPNDDNDNTTPTWMLVLIVVGVFILFILFPLSFVIFRRSVANAYTNNASQVSEIQSGIESMGIDSFLSLAK